MHVFLKSEACFAVSSTSYEEEDERRGKVGEAVGVCASRAMG